MSRLRALDPRLIMLVLFGISLLVRVATWLAFPHPAYVDSTYYASVAQAMAAGDGMSIGYLWSFSDAGGAIPAVPALPLPAFAHWTPAASLIQLPFIAVLGPTPLASSLPFILLASAMAPLTYAMARDLFNRRAAALAGLLTVFPAASAFVTQTDNFALFAVIVTAALWLLARALRDGARVGAMALAGVLTAAAFLSRNDGVLLAVLVAVLAAADWLGAWRHSRPRRFGALPLAAFYATALLGVLPWLARQLATFGSLQPSSASGRILWIREYPELFGADGALGPQHLLSWGLDNLLFSRLEAAAYSGHMIFAVLFAGIGLPLALLAAWRRRRHPGVRVYAAWVLVFHAWAIGVAAPHLPTGNYLHGAISLTLFGSVLVALGLTDVAAAVRRRWSRHMAARVLHNGAILLVAVYASLAVFAGVKVTQAWNADWKANTAIVRWLDEHAQRDDVIYAASPGPYWYIGGYHGVPTPTSVEPVLRRAADAYDARWLILDADSIVDALKPVLAGEQRLDWLSDEPVFEIRGNDGDPGWAIYRIELP